jgi:hypothetical protein
MYSLNRNIQIVNGIYLLKKIIRRIYGPVMKNNVWRIRCNEELNTLLKGEDIVRLIKSQRIRWLGHVERMEENVKRKTVLQKKERKT